MSSPTYPKYKSSGMKWLGDLPEHWKVRSLKHIVSTPITDGPHETPVFLDVGIPFVSAEAVAGGEIDFSKIRAHISFEDHYRYSAKYAPKRHDIYMVKSGATTGVTAIVDTDIVFNIWSPLAAIRCDHEIAHPFYVLNFLRSRNFQEAVTLNWSFGTQQNIGMGVLGNLSVALPPLEEQLAIATFLRSENAKIDALISEQEKLIALLAEKRQATIFNAVTKGLNPNAPMKDSGVEWLGKVPEHWTVCSLKRVFFSSDYGISDALDGDGAVPVLRMGNIVDGKVMLDDLKYIDKVDDSLLLRKGDLLFNRTNSLDLVGKVGMYVGDSEKNITFASYLVRLRLVKTCLPEFFAYFLNTRGLLGDVRSRAFVAIGQCNLNPTRYGEIVVATPPLEDQVAITEKLNVETARFDLLMAQAKRGISLLKERRSALVSAAVTGKIDVRHVVQQEHITIQKAA